MSYSTRMQFFASLLRPALAQRSPASRPRIRLGLISEGTNTWPLYAALSLHLFEQAGIDVDVSLVGSSVKQQEALIAGEFDVGFQQADHVVRAVEQGSDLFVFMAQGHAPDLSLVVAPGITDFSELKGRPIAVDGARTGYALLLRRLLEQKGLAPADVAFAEVGGSKERYDALKSGSAVASLLNPPFDANLLAEGYGSLASMSECFPSYPGSIAAARRAWAREHREELVAFIRAFNAGYAWLQNPANRDEALALLPERLQISGKAASRAFGRIAERERPAITTEGLEQVVQTVWAAEGRAGAPPAPGKYVDMSYFERAAATPLKGRGE
jgi:ABC-type nitrate/sulfonate/bicarbonate transport system substrate-binding protein